MRGAKARKLFRRLVLLFLTVWCQTLGAQESSASGYRIAHMTFLPQGKTKAQAVERALPALKNIPCFESIEELIAFLDTITQDLENTRLFESISYTYSVGDDSEDVYLPVDVVYTITDSHSFAIVPSPKIDSNSGSSLRLRLMDQNFMGLMRPLSLGVSGQLGTEDAPEDTSQLTLGFDFSYDYPFTVGETQNSWRNAFALSWLTSEKTPDFFYTSDLTVGIPFGQNMLQVHAGQSIIQNMDYKKYNDELYFIERVGLSLPLWLGTIDGRTPVLYEPFATFSYTWDENGIDERNTKLRSSPALSVGQRFRIHKVNWQGNFRKGYVFSAMQSVTRDFHDTSFDTMLHSKIALTLQFYKSWSFMGLCTNFHFFTIWNDTENPAMRLRGILDKQLYAPLYHIDKDNYAIETSAAFIANIELPIHLFSTRWQGRMAFCNVELQAVPFIDIGLLKNRATGKTFSLKEGLYTGGMELLFYPQRWKSYVIRASLGFDLSDMLLDGHNGFDSSWRTPKHDYEFFLGIGHQF